MQVRFLPGAPDEISNFMKRLLGLVAISALVFVGAGCKSTVAPAPVPAPVVVTPPPVVEPPALPIETPKPASVVMGTYGKMFEAWFEGWDRAYLTFSYPTSAFTLTEKDNAITLAERGTTRVHKITANFEGGRGQTPADYWKETKPCPACTPVKPSLVVIKGVTNILDYASAEKEYILFSYAAWTFVVELDHPTDVDRAIVNSFVLADSIQEPAKFSFLKIGLIALGDAGKLGEKIGCDDSAVLQEIAVPKTSQVLNAALRALFASDNETYPDTGFINVLPKMPLAFDHATLDSGVARIYLTGATTGLGGVCDEPRWPAQIRATAKQFSTVKTVEIYIGGVKQL